MNDLQFPEKILLSAGTILFFAIMHSVMNCIAKKRNVTRCLKNAIDDKLPFVPQLVYFYFFTYVFNTVCLFIIIYDQPMKEFLTVIKILITLIISGSIFYVIFPAMIIKPRIEKPEGISLKLVALHNNGILPYNSFPSLHVAFSVITVLLAFHLNSSLRYLYLVLLFLIAGSALLTKQHYIIDVIAGFILAIILFAIFYSI
ncbi:MAG: hypothetical protein A2Y62_12050 [Candidatus Fischerbacteria bacterium RBG_13_37_8]|uniref:Inositolphosphotransferase Aur1/Ipt1 domain-containing protein n=1 Tax=Candidatus Fischerbacteria bacterium RBG_13_37_8 TaxID=1817863 RepID=A0A1F5VES6_9BACT|nr:MAG: hypothetical protein A2Y62_12050 [Candidatus Fischerbacteria bacterium RBG_13_37_8]